MMLGKAVNPALTSVSPRGEGQQCLGACRGDTPAMLTCPSGFSGQGTCAGAVRPRKRPVAPRTQPGALPHGKAPPEPLPGGLYPSCTPKGGTVSGWGGGQQGPRCWRVAGDAAVGRPAWQELLGRLPHGGGTGRPATQKGQLPPLTRVRFLHSCQGARAECGQAGTRPRRGRVPPRPAQPCRECGSAQCSHRLPGACDRAGPRPCPLHAHGSRRSPGTPTAEQIFMLSPGIDISVDQSNISQVFFLLATGMRSFGLGVLDVEKLLLGGGHAAVPGA